MRRFVDSICTVLGAAAILLVGFGLVTGAGFAYGDPPPVGPNCVDDVNCTVNGPGTGCIVAGVFPVEVGNCDHNPPQNGCSCNYFIEPVTQTPDCDCATLP